MAEQILTPTEALAEKITGGDLQEGKGQLATAQEQSIACCDHRAITRLADENHWPVETGNRSLHPWRCRPRQDHVDGYVHRLLTAMVVRSAGACIFTISWCWPGI